MSNPLARSRLEKAKIWLATEPNAPKNYTKSGNEINRETIRAAIDALLEPKVDWGMATAGWHKIPDYDAGNDDVENIYKAMISELTKEQP